ncbi:unnamed protein product [Peronospora belbahrii]|uniref:Uncharacterized protein n=1 Tax=Peronospora belbahrii TaxID=622444 RepID=A0AAU9KMR9_9STRA|nr:unnamed protein product [Peronospora belbahrii]
MERPSCTRQEITPLHVPWLEHENFNMTKMVCSTTNGLVTSSKNSLIRVVQELKRGRIHVDKQLSRLETQLLSISDYLDGKKSTMFPPHLITYVDNTPMDITIPLTTGVRRHCGTVTDAVVEKFHVMIKKESALLTPAMVEEDLNSDTPCTTTGLWKYLNAYSFFKTITPDDMDKALLLEDSNAFCEDLESCGNEKDGITTGLDFQQLQDNFSLSRFTSHDLDDFFMERLVASLCAVDTHAVVKENDESIFCQPDDEDKHSNDTTETTTDMETSDPLCSINVQSWNSMGLTRVLRNIGLVEGNDQEVVRVGLSSPMDDGVSQEIRSLKRQLQTCVRETNETKRKLRKIMAETKPWLSMEKEEEKATLEQYFIMWQTKKELARKKKQREKKLQRRQALRLGGGGSGKPLADDISSSNDRDLGFVQNWPRPNRCRE